MPIYAHLFLEAVFSQYNTRWDLRLDGQLQPFSTINDALPKRLLFSEKYEEFPIENFPHNESSLVSPFEFVISSFLRLLEVALSWHAQRAVTKSQALHVLTCPPRKDVFLVPRFKYNKILLSEKAVLPNYADKHEITWIQAEGEGESKPL